MSNEYNDQLSEHIPMYIRIAMDIRKKILSGKYLEEEQISTEDEIGVEYGVSRMTARNAITQLVEENLVYRVHGRGTFVSKNKIERNLNKVTGFHEDMLSMGLNPSSKVIKFITRLPDAKEQHELKIRKNDKVFEINRIRYIDDVPYGYQELVIPVRLLQDLKKEDIEKSSLYTYMNKLEKPISYANQHMEVAIKPEINELIGISENIPFFKIKRVSFLANNEAVELFHSYFRGDKFSYSLQLSNHIEEEVSE
ncbi:GntR family transcriptional regulator [Sporosarcina ureae]|uniref:GntR family transcriptional regulator n=1 Tax=Sporosarcina ureae TaxID=1571 RepID=UPI0026F34820|nr:GntR family transcriptional regulator [Sporosarcina ureae]